MIHIIHCYSKHICWVAFEQILLPAFVTLIWSKIVTACLMQNVISTRLNSSVDNVAFTSWYAIAEWIAHSGVGTPLHREKKKEGENERPFDERTEPSPPLALFPPSFPSLPCGVNLAKRRQHQPIYTSCMHAFFFFFFWAVPSTSHASPVSPPPHQPLCSLWFHYFACVCVHNECFVLQALGGGIISSTVEVKHSPAPEAGNTSLTQAVQLRCHGTGIAPPICAPPPYCAVCHMPTFTFLC